MLLFLTLSMWGHWEIYPSLLLPLLPIILLGSLTCQCFIFCHQMGSHPSMSFRVGINVLLVIVFWIPFLIFPFWRSLEQAQAAQLKGHDDAVAGAVKLRLCLVLDASSDKVHCFLFISSLQLLIPHTCCWLPILFLQIQIESRNCSFQKEEYRTLVWL